MGVFYETIPSSLSAWCLTQSIFWVSTCPLSPSGHVNLSPKGGTHFGIPSPTQFWYVDLSGSGSETLSHLYEPNNARICIMFNAFDGPPKIVRFWGRGRVLEFGTPGYDGFVKENKLDLEGRMEGLYGVRSIIVVDVEQVGSSCGFSVPRFELKGYRTQLNEIFEKKERNDEVGNRKDGLEQYWAYKNAYSIDGLPAMRRGLETGKRENVAPIKKMVGPNANPLAAGGGSQLDGIPLAFLAIIAILGFCVGIVVTIAAQIHLGLGTGTS